MRKKILLLIGLSLLVMNMGNAQSLTNYVFNATSGTYTAIAGNYVNITGDTDEGYFSGIPIGFTFYYMGTPYTTIGASTNGWASLGGTLTGAAFTNNLATGGVRPVLAPLWDDVEAVSGLWYETTGAPGSRIFTIEWKNVQWDYLAAASSLSFQLKLYESNSAVQFIYTQEPGALNAPSASIGMTATGTGANNFVSLNNSSAAPTLSYTVETTTIATQPATGQTYTFTPPVGIPASPANITFTAVTTSGMTVNWDDASTSETFFKVYNSLDGITYTQVGTVASTTTAGTGTTYNYVATGLFTNTLYYWRIEACNEGSAPSAPLAGSQATLGGTMCGTYTVGPTGAYTSLTAAFAAVVTNGVGCPVNFELQAAYNSSVETFPLVVPNMNNSPVDVITVRPQTGATALSITSANTTGTLNFDAANNVRFDGRPGGVGTAIELTIANTATAGFAIRFQNNASGDTIRYCNIRGVTTGTTNGVVNFANGTAGNGNKNIAILNSDLGDGATPPQIMIYSANATGSSFNENITIANNNIRNFFNNGSSAGILMAGNTRNWTISDNSFYQTATRTYTTAATTHYAIRGSSTTNQGMVITDNVIGGTAPSLGGGDYTMTAAATIRFVGIELSGAAGQTPHSVQGNVIQKFNFTSTGANTTANGNWCGINIISTGNSANVGTITPNIIGSASAANAIITSTGGNGGLTVGINNSASGTVNIQNNLIGGITANSSGPTVSSSLIGIQNSGTGTINISGNSVGSTTINNSMINAVSISATAGQVGGIISTGTAIMTITQNAIMNLTNQYGGTSTTGYIRGIAASTGTNTISNNTIANLAHAGIQTGTNANAIVQGITQSGTTAAQQNIFGNTITNIGNVYNLNSDVVVSGITFTGSTTFRHQIYDNEIIGLGAPLNTGNPIINGITIYGGTSRIYNNMVALGVTSTGTDLTTSHVYQGIVKSSTTANAFIHNSVRISGSGVAAGANNSFAFNRTGASGIDSLVNNIFSNDRSNGASTGTHYSVGLANTTTLVSDKNIYYGAGTGYAAGLLGATPYTTLIGFAGATGLDANSFQMDPYFVSTTDLHINNAFTSILESRAIVTDIDSDIDGDVRPGPVGSVNGGGTIPDIGADEFDGVPLALDMGAIALVDPSDSACYSANEDIRIRVRNFSTQAINFAVNPTTLSSFVTGINPVVFPNVVLNTGILAPNGTLDTLVATGYDMSALGTYTFRAYTTLPGDVIVSNDSMTVVSINVSAGTATATPASNVCNYDNVTLQLAGSTNGGSIQWEASTDFGGSWNNVVGGTTSTYVVNPGDTTYYRAIVCGTYTSNVVMVEPTVVGDVASADTSRCGAGPVTMIASGPNNIYWYDVPTGGTPLFTGSTYNTSVAATDTFYVSNGTGIPNATHTTNLTSNNGGAAVMFPIYAINTVTITGFDVNYSNTTTANWEIWYRPDNYIPVVGANTSSAGWTFVGSANVAGNGQDIPTPLPIPVNITIPAGQAYSFYIQETGTGTHRYITGVGLGNVYNSNADFEFIEGHAGTGTPFNCTLSPRVFSGNIHYKTGCESLRDTVVVTVTPAASLNATASANPICDIDSVGLNVTSVNTSYSYTWSSTSAMSSTTGASITGYPTSGLATFYVAAVDTAGCLNSDTVNVQVNVTPTGTFTVSDNVLCLGDSSNLQIDASLGGTFSHTSIAGAIPDADPAGGFYDTIMVASAPSSLQSGDLVSVCIDITHTWNSDLDIYLISPLGTQIELSTDNGGTGDNYTGTCFTMTAATSIVAATAPMTGTYLPEGIFDSFNGENANGGWVLRVADDLGGDVGTLNSWSIEFLPTSPDVQWSSNPIGLNDTTNMVTVMPTVTTEYTVTITDLSNGCSRDYTDTVVVNPLPVVSLGNDTIYCMNDAVGFTLDASGAGFTYTWQDNSTNATYQVTLPGTYFVEVVDANGCVNADTIMVSGVMPVQVSIDVDFTSTTTATLDAGPGFSSYTWNTTATSQTINISSNGTYVVQTTDANNCVTTDTVNIVFSLGVFNPDGSESFLQLYPNPSHGAFNVTIDNLESSDVVIDILDMNGRIVYNRYVGSVEGSTIQSFNMEDLRAGTYNLRVTANGKASTLRFIINK